MRTDITDPNNADYEACDDGNVSNTDACLNSCVDADCGDGFEWTNVEECDDGNDNNRDACLNACIIASCGDGVLRNDLPVNNPNYEECDDGNSSNNDSCVAQCRSATCGDLSLEYRWRQRAVR